MLVSIFTDVLYSSSSFKRTGAKSIFRKGRVNGKNWIVLACHRPRWALSCCSVLVCRWPLTLNTPQCHAPGLLPKAYTAVSAVCDTHQSTNNISHKQKAKDMHSMYSSILEFSIFSSSAFLYFQSNQDQTLLTAKQMYNRLLKNYWGVPSSWMIPHLI